MRRIFQFFYLPFCVPAECWPHFHKFGVGFYSVRYARSTPCIRYWSGDPFECILVWFVSHSAPLTQYLHHVRLKYAASGTIHRLNRFIYSSVQIAATALFASPCSSC